MKVVFRYKKMFFNILLINLISSFSCKNNEFTDNICTVRSIRGSGSLYPCCFALKTVSENGTSLEISLKIKLSVPDKTASILRILSPEFRKSFIVPIIGNPAPTFVSNRNLTPRSASTAHNYHMNSMLQFCLLRLRICYAVKRIDRVLLPP